MSLLNLTNDGLPNVLYVLCTHLMDERGQLGEKELLNRVAPASLVESYAGSLIGRQLRSWGAADSAKFTSVSPAGALGVGHADHGTPSGHDYLQPVQQSDQLTAQLSAVC